MSCRQENAQEETKIPLNTPVKVSRAQGLRSYSWNQLNVRALIYQVLVLVAVAAVVGFLIVNTRHNLASRNIAVGFDFLHREAGFAIGEMAISYTPADTYGRAILVGLINTLKVAVLGIVFATLLGTVLGIARLSKNWLVAKLAAMYVEVIRNVPLLLQLFFWYALVTENMPGPRDAHHPLPGVFISNRGLALPSLSGHAWDGILAGLGVAIILTLILAHWRRDRWGRGAIALLLILPAIGVWVSGASLHVEMPVLQGFDFAGGMTLTPEFFALLLGLSLYTAAFTAEVVRAGIQAVNLGQWEAAQALGLSRTLVLRFIVLPQALRSIIPPMTSQYLNLTKNSSLAVAIGYPDLVSVVNTTLNQTGQAIEGILIIMAAYLTVSLSISLLMNGYNQRIVRER